MGLHLRGYEVVYRPSGTPLSLDDARRLAEGHVEHYNTHRLNSATGYITPADMLAARQQEIHAERDRKLGGTKTAADSSPARKGQSPVNPTIEKLPRPESCGFVNIMPLERSRPRGGRYACASVEHFGSG